MKNCYTKKTSCFAGESGISKESQTHKHQITLKSNINSASRSRVWNVHKEEYAQQSGKMAFQSYFSL